MSNTIEIGLRVVVQNHMPFTAGTYVFKQLRTVGTVTRNSPMHDLPVSEWRYATEFMTIRPIPDWYRS
ncbi:MAG: hypothetical protein ACWGQW_23150, partial [bacterium]